MVVCSSGTPAAGPGLMTRSTSRLTGTSIVECALDDLDRPGVGAPAAALGLLTSSIVAASTRGSWIAQRNARSACRPVHSDNDGMHSSLCSCATGARLTFSYL